MSQLAEGFQISSRRVVGRLYRPVLFIHMLGFSIVSTGSTGEVGLFGRRMHGLAIHLFWVPY